MPSTIPDLAWYVSTGVIVVLMSTIAGLLAWGFGIFTKKMDEIGNKLDRWADHVIMLERRMDARDAICEERHRQWTHSSKQ